MSKIFKLEEAERVEDPGTRTMHWLMNAGLGAEKMRVVVYDFEPNLRFDKVHYHAGDIHGVVGTGEDGLKMLEAWAPAERDTTYMDYERKE